MNRKLARLLAVCAVALWLLSLAGVAYAAPAAQGGDTGLQINGAVFNLANATPGQTYYHRMVVGSGANSPALDVTIEARGFGETLDGAFVPLPPEQDKSPQSARTFITNIDHPSFRLPPGGSVPVTATIMVPSDVGTNTRYALIYISTAPVAQGNGIAQILAASVPVVITPVGAKLDATGAIQDLTVSPVESGKPIEVLTTVGNTGNRHFKVQGKVIITDPAGQTLATVPLPLTSSSIFPMFAQRLMASYTPVGQATSLQPGTYSVEADIAYEDGSPLGSQRTTFEVKAPYQPFPGVDDAHLFIKTFNDEEPGTVDASAKTDVIIVFEGTGKVTGSVAIGKYLQEPAGDPRFEARPGDGGMGATGLNFVGVRVQGFSQGVAHFTMRYTAPELGGVDPNSLYLAYRDGTSWRKLTNLSVQTGAQAVLGDLPVSALAAGPLIVLGGSGAAPGGTLATLWPIGAGVAGGAVIIGLSVGMVVSRRKRG